MSKRLIALACAGSVLLSGCAGVGNSQPLKPGLSEEAIRSTALRQPRESEIVYLLLSGEIAGQRGQFESALENYLKAAKLTKDPRVAARATQIALYLKNMDKALAAAVLWRERDPGNIDALRLSAMLELKAGHTDAAFEQLRQSACLAPGRSGKHVDRVGQAAGRGSLQGRPAWICCAGSSSVSPAWRRFTSPMPCWRRTRASSSWPWVRPSVRWPCIPTGTGRDCCRPRSCRRWAIPKRHGR